jgi:hypothetical protein
MYCFSEAANPPKHRFIDPVNELYATLLFYDGRHFKNVINILEPTGAENKVTMRMLASLGLQ